MTNTQQTVLDHVCGAEQSQEEIQLTELLPVEQSRIEDTSDNKDTGTTDGLKVLRSFSQNNHSEFDARLYGKIQNYELSSKSTFDIADVEPNMSWAREIHTTINNNDNENKNNDNTVNGDINASDDHAENDNNDNTDDTDVSGLKYNNLTLKRKLRRIKNNNKTRKRRRLQEDDLFKDEVFYYQQQSDSDHEIHLNSQKGKKRNSARGKHDKLSKNCETDNSDKNIEISENQNESDNDLKRNMGAIIKSNYLLEQENNNDVQDNNNTENSLEKPTNNVKNSGVRIPKIKKIKRTEDESVNGENKKYSCMMCDAKFKGSGGLRNHWKVIHAGGPAFKCDDCGKEFPLKERLKLHVRTHTGFKPYKCSECNKSFARGGQLAQHRLTHSHIKPYHCALCSGTFSCSANLALHMKRHNNQKDHKCDICGRGFIRRDALKKHLECLHKDVRSFLCIICNKTFKGHLPQHMRTHCQDRPHGCATCGQRFAQKSQLTVHQRTHSGQRPFRCLVCWQAFAHSTALKLHTRRHTGERPFKCTECNAGFTQLPHWKKHMKCIHGRNEPYSCKNCNLFFRIKNDLENHEKNCVKTTEDCGDSNGNSGNPSNRFYCMTIERMRLLLAVLLKRISKQEKLDELGFGKRLIDQVLQDSLISAGKEPAQSGELTEFEALRKNLEMFLEWTVPKEHWSVFKKMNKRPEQILEILTTT